MATVIAVFQGGGPWDGREEEISVGTSMIGPSRFESGDAYSWAYVRTPKRKDKNGKRAYIWTKNAF